ncbi:MAG: AbrB/MazE/SpoVT family DNA-binding domain-containing protein [Saprospiraceae bacterium]|nr:AbrB/MazE/SpoVT family DNA-binding domain-containing protein [Saprospiraceae bacterium]
MQAKIIRIGNSKGLRLSKTILDKYEIKDKVELVLEEDYLVLKAVSTPREGWEQKFKKMHELGHDSLLIDDVFDDEHFE